MYSTVLYYTEPTDLDVLPEVSPLAGHPTLDLDNGLYRTVVLTCTYTIPLSQGVGGI